MNMFRRKRSHSTPPPDRSTTVAATTAAHIASQGHERSYTGLSSAAAAAALRNKTPTPEPPLPASPRRSTHSRQGSGDSDTGSQRAVKSRMSDRNLRPYSPVPLEAREPRFAASDSGLPSPPRTAGFPIDALRPPRERAPSILASVREEQSDGEGEYFEDPDEEDGSITPDGYSPTSPTSRSAYYGRLPTSAAASYARNGVRGQASAPRRFVPVDAVAGSQPGAVAGTRARGGPSAEAIALAQAMYHAQTGKGAAQQRHPFSKAQGTAVEPAPSLRSKTRDQPHEPTGNQPSAEAIELAKQMLLENPNGILKSKKSKKKKKKRKDEEDEEEPKEEPNHFKDYLLKNFGEFDDDEYAARTRRQEGRRLSLTMASLSSFRTWSTGRSRRDSIGTDRRHFSHTDRETMSSISTRHDSLVGNAIGVPNPTDAQRAQLSKRPRPIDIGRFMFEQRTNLDPVLDVPGSSDSKQDAGKQSEEAEPNSPESIKNQREEWEAVRARWSNLKSQQWQNVQEGVELEPEAEEETVLKPSPKQDASEEIEETEIGATGPKPQPKALLAVSGAGAIPDDSSSVYSNRITYDAPVGLENPEERAAKEEAALAAAKAKTTASEVNGTPKKPKKPSLLPAAEIVEKKRLPTTLRGDKSVKIKQPPSNGVAASRAAAHSAQRSADLEPELVPESVKGQYHAEAPPLQRTNSDSSFKRKHRPSTANTATAQPAQRYSMSMPMRNTGPPHRPASVSASRPRMTPSVAPPPRSYSPDSVRGLKTLGRKSSVARFFGRFTRNSHAYVG